MKLKYAHTRNLSSIANIFSKFYCIFLQLKKVHILESCWPWFFFSTFWGFLFSEGLKVWVQDTSYLCSRAGQVLPWVFRWMGGFMMETCSAHHVGTSVSSVLQKQILQLLTWLEHYPWVSSLCGWNKEDFSWKMLKIPQKEALKQVVHLLF